MEEYEKEQQRMKEAPECALHDMEDNQMNKYEVMVSALALLAFSFAGGTALSALVYLWMLKDKTEGYFESGILFKDRVLKSKYEQIGMGTALECFGGYKTYKMKNNKSINISQTIMVCD